MKQHDKQSTADKVKPLPPRSERKHSEAAVDEALVDEAVAETMVASDPISPYSRETSKPVQLRDDEEQPAGSDEAPPTKWQGWKRGE